MNTFKFNDRVRRIGMGNSAVNVGWIGTVYGIRDDGGLLVDWDQDSEGKWRGLANAPSYLEPADPPPAEPQGSAVWNWTCPCGMSVTSRLEISACGRCGREWYCSSMATDAELKAKTEECERVKAENERLQLERDEPRCTLLLCREGKPCKTKSRELDQAQQIARLETALGIAREQLLDADERNGRMLRELERARRTR